MLDLNECEDVKLHDCDKQFARCYNLEGYYDCVCDVNSNDKSTNIDFAGRNCSGQFFV